MRLLRRLAGGLHALVRRSRVDQDLDAELQAFFESSVEEKIRAGATREAATRAARLELGSLAAVKDHVRDAGWEAALESVWQDARYGARTLRRSPSFAVITIVLLALGIGANSAIFSLINALMLRPLPVREPSSLVEPLSRYPGEPRMNGFSWEFYEQLRDRSTVFSDVVGIAPLRIAVSRNGDAETVDGEYVVGALFPALGVPAAIGRLIEPHDARAGASPVAVLSWSYWKTRFDSSPAVLGSQVSLNGVSATVIGVAPRAFTGLRPGVSPAIWLPVTRPMALGLIARLKPGVSRDQARAELRILHRPHIERLGKNDPRWLQADIELAPAGAGFSTVRDRLGTPLLALMLGVGILLLLACTNIASLLLARAAGRAREMAVRVSLGAGRMRLFRQVLTESLLLSGAGALLGVMLAYWGAGALVRMMMSGRLPPGWPARLELQLAPDGRVLLFTLGVAMVTALIFGLVPAWTAFTSPPITSLRGTGPGAEKKAPRLFGQGLVVVQVALSIVLVSGAALFVGHLSGLRNRDLGFQRQGVLLVTLNAQGSGLNRTQLTQLYRELLDRLHAIPGVQSATLSGVTPIEGGAASRFVSLDGYHEAPDARRRVSLNTVAPRYFETLGTAVLAGRDFQFEDATRPPVVIVNRAMARHYFGDASPLGRRFSLEREPLPFEIIGVVEDAKYADLREPAPRTVYLSAFQDGRIASHFALRSGQDPLAIAAQVRRVVHEVVPAVQIARVTTLDDQLNASLVIERVMTTLSVLFGVVGAVLAALGLYGLLAYTVARRTSEIGLRMALGATERDVLRMVLTGGAGLVAAGLAAGVPVAWWTARIAARLVANLPSGSSWPVAIAGAVLLVIALLAAYVPARRASRIQPIDALRQG